MIRHYLRQLRWKLRQLKPHFHRLSSGYHNWVMYDFTDEWYIRRTCTSSQCRYWIASPVKKSMYERLNTHDKYVIDNYLRRAGKEYNKEFVGYGAKSQWEEEKK